MVEELEQKFKDLIISYLLNQTSEEEKVVLLDWLKKSDENKKIFAEYNKLYHLSFFMNDYNKFSEKKLENWKTLTDQIDTLSGETHPTPVIKLPTYLKTAVAALLIFFAGGITFHWVYKPTASLNLSKIEYKVNAPIGGKSEVILADGTKVWLNAGTHLNYMADYGINDRVVYLDGEGYFQVVKNPEKPFVVNTSGLKIKAFGTSFNVKAYPEEKCVTTTLVEGVVTIEGKGVNLSLKPKEVVIVDKKSSTRTAEVNNRMAVAADSNAVTKANAYVPHPLPGHKGSYVNDKVKVVSNVNTKIYTSWKDDVWIIESDPLKNIAVILERKFNVSVEIKSGELNKYTFTGTFNKETLEQILDIIKLTAPLNYRINKGVVTITEEQKRKATYYNFIK